MCIICIYALKQLKIGVFLKWPMSLGGGGIVINMKQHSWNWKSNCYKQIGEKTAK